MPPCISILRQTFSERRRIEANEEVRIFCHERGLDYAIEGSVFFYFFLYRGFFHAGFQSPSFASEAVRQPAVAGQFYPADPDSLKNLVQHYIAGGCSLPVAPRIIISPHAGYIFSGPGSGQRVCGDRSGVKTVIILGPPHHLPVRGIAAPSVEWFKTPLGKVPLDRERIRKLLENPLPMSMTGLTRPNTASRSRSRFCRCDFPHLKSCRSWFLKPTPRKRRRPSIP